MDSLRPLEGFSALLPTRWQATSGSTILLIAIIGQTHTTDFLHMHCTISPHSAALDREVGPRCLSSTLELFFRVRICLNE